MDEQIILFILLTYLIMVKSAIPGTYFWKPRIGLDLNLPVSEVPENVNALTKENIEKGVVIVLEGYQVGVTILGLSFGISSSERFPHLNPFDAHFFTNGYRWFLRHMDLIPLWLSGTEGSYCDTQNVWKRRFHYMEDFIPKWMKFIIPFIKKEDWEQEKRELRRYKKYAESTFGRHYKYPAKEFHDLKSDKTLESPDVEISSDTSTKT